MLKDLFGTILGRRESMYKFIYYHTFGRLILTYVLFAVGYSLIKLIDTYVVVQYIPQIDFLVFYLISLNSLTYIIISLAMLLAAIAIIVFVLAKLFRKKFNSDKIQDIINLVPYDGTTLGITLETIDNDDENILVKSTTSDTALLVFKLPFEAVTPTGLKKVFMNGKTTRRFSQEVLNRKKVSNTH